MKNISKICVSSFLLFVVVIKSQTFGWAKSYGGETPEGALAVTVDPSGNIISTGIFRGTADFDPGTGTAIRTSLGDWDVFIQKLDSDGNFLWVKTFGGASADHAESVFTDQNGNVYTTGRFMQTVDFDPSAEVTSYSSSGDFDAFIQKLDSDGNFLWAKAFGGTSNDEIYSLKVDNNGNVYTTGHFYGSVDFDPGSEVYTLATSENNRNTFVQKMETNGNFLWAKSFAGGANWGTSLNLDSSGNIYTTGTIFGQTDFDPGSGTFLLNSSQYYGTFVQKMDSSGNFLWAKSFGGAYNLNTSYSTVDSSGNIYTTGSFDFPGDYDPSDGTSTLTSNGHQDVFIQKMDASGNFLWAKNFGGSCEYCVDVSKSISVDTFGNIYTTGFFANTTDLDPGPGIAHYTSAGNDDIFIQKLDTSGNFIWGKSLGSSAQFLSETGQSLYVDSEGSVLVTGNFCGIVDFDDGSGVANLTPVGYSDIFLLKITQNLLSSTAEESRFDALVYPNPTSGKVQLVLQESLENVELLLSDSSGTIISKQNKKLSKINQLELPKNSGIYFLTVKTPKGNKTFKLIKK